MPYSRCRADRASTICMVEQLGLATMRSVGFTASMFISGTTRGTCGSLRQAELLSTTVVPTAANSGAYWREASAPAEKMA